MCRILINAVSAKHGGARTIIESLVEAAPGFEQLSFIVFAGFKPDHKLPQNVTWRYMPKNSAAAAFFSLISIAFLFLLYRADFVISFNNINTPLVVRKRLVTYFHQMKALDPSFSEFKVRVIRAYLRCSSEPVVVQSEEVKSAFVDMFGSLKHEVIVTWPGISVPPSKSPVFREPFMALVPLSSPQSPHKNFAFINAVAEGLGSNWRVIVTSNQNGINLGQTANNIEFVGSITRPEMFELYRRATICLFGSTHETIGLPIFEALAVGTPVIAYDAAYVHAFREKFGISEGLYLAKTPEAAVAKISELNGKLDSRIVVTRNFCEDEWNILLSRFQTIS